MSNINQNSDGSKKGGSGIGNSKGTSRSGSLPRIVILVVIFAVAAGGIWGYRQYLESIIPKGDERFIKKTAPGTEEPGPVPTGMEVLAEMFSAPQPSQEIEELKKKKANEVAFTYDAIIKMTPAELEKNIKEVSEQLETMRSSLAPSIGGASAGSSAPPETTENDDKPATREVTIPSLALPLEVMKQISENK